MAHLTLQVEHTNTRLTWRGQARAAEEFDRKTIGLRVVGGDEGEHGRLAAAVWAEDAASLAAVEGPPEAWLGFVGLLPVA